MENIINDDARTLSSRKHAEEVLAVALKGLEDNKAEAIEVIDLEGKADFAHFMVVATGRSARHVSSTADGVADEIINFGIDGVGIEGKLKGDWVLIDAKDVIIHVMRAEIRDQYQLEKMWNV